jgi:hypothetical protein
MANPAATLVKTHLTMSLPRAMTSALAVRGIEEGQYDVFFYIVGLSYPESGLRGGLHQPSQGRRQQYHRR